MKILEMTATFGRLSGDTLRPGPGLTLIEAPNEWGKSTWGAFLRAMLYGFPARDRDKAGYIAEKNRYQPWSGAPMEGSLTLEWKGRQLTLRRGPKGAAVWGAFSATWNDTHEPVEGLTGDNCGEILLGVTREVFERTAFLGQGEGALTPSADLEKRIAALATSGDEEVSYSQVESRLREWRNRRRVNARVGLIPELEGQLSQREAALDRQQSLLERELEASRRREELEEERDRLEAGLSAHRAWNAAQQRRRRAEAQTDLETARARLEQAQAAVRDQPPAEVLHQAQADLKYRNNLDQARKEAEKALPLLREETAAAKAAALSDPWFGGQDPAKAAAKAQADRDRAAAPAKKPAPWMWVVPILLVCGAVGLLAAALLTERYLMLIPVNAAVILACALVLIRTALSAKKAKELAAQQAELLTKYAAETPDDILRRAEEYGQKARRAQEAERAQEEGQARLDTLTAQCDELESGLFALVRPFAPEVTSLFGVSAALTRALQQGDWYRDALAQVQAAQRVLAALPDPGEGDGPAPTQPPEGDPAALSARLALVTRDLEGVRDEDARLRGELSSLGDPAALEAEAGRLRGELAGRQEELEALNIALESLKGADDRLRERFSPAVNAQAGHYLSALTGGKYTAAALTRQFQALAEEGEGSAPRRDLVLSGGTAQQLYLAIRLAMCDLVLPKEEPCPILLDDALDPFDDERAGLALQCLLDLAKGRQILLFSCHSREGKLLQGTEATLLRV